LQTKQKKITRGRIMFEISLIKNNKLLIKYEQKEYYFEEVVFLNEKMLELIKKACLYAKNSNLICLRGESGVGKEIVYRIINTIFGNKQEVTVNCGAINDNLLESELFGHKKGSFTSAISDRKGAFLQAGEGYLFLDEIGELSLKAQAKLLRALEQSEIKPVGSDLSFKHKAKIILATHRDLRAMVDEGTFRKDLYYRIEAYTINIPSLRERINEIVALSKVFLGPCYNLSKSAINYMKKYEWPGNIRELKNALYRAKVNSEYGAKEISWEMLGVYDDMATKVNKMCTLSQMEEAFVRNVYVRCNKNINKVSEVLGIPRSTVYSKLKRFNI